MRPVSQDIVDILSDAGLGLTTADNLFAGEYPDKPDQIVMVSDAPGNTPDIHGYRKPAVQVLVRSNKYDTGWDLANDIAVYLHASYGYKYDGVYYTGIWMSTDVERIGRDDKQRHLFAVNFEVQRR